MMAQQLRPPVEQPARISQLLPTVKCSTCNRLVPLADLGDHVCTAPPPVPSLPKPTTTPSQAAALLPQRLQNLVTPTTPRAQQQQPDPRSISPARSVDSSRFAERPRINTGFSSSSAPTSAMAASPSRTMPRAIPARPGNDLYGPVNGSPLAPPAPSFRSRDRSGSTASNQSSNQSSPSTARPYGTQTPTQAQQQQPRDVDTRAGGQGGMAGVGRRGFQAAARVALYPPEPSQTLRANAPKFLDLDSSTSRSSATPPLSAGSGYSSHSPGLASPFPQSPVLAPPRTSRSPSPSGRYDVRNVRPPEKSNNIPIPLVDKYQNNPPRNNEYNRGPSPAVPRGREGILNNSQPIRAASTRSRQRPRSPSSGSEYSGAGLAYADSTDNESDQGHRSKAHPPPPLPLNGSSLLRSASREGRVKFSDGDGPTGPRMRHQKSSGSVSSVSSSVSGDDRKNRSNSTAIAHALGLSQTPPQDYGRMGGPGMTRTPSRSGRSDSSSGSRSAYSRNTDSSLSANPTMGIGKLEKAMETLLEDVGGNDASASRPGLSKSKSTGKQRTFTHSKSGSVASMGSSVGLAAGTMSGARTQRSNTLNVSSSPETKPVKLPTRAKTEKERSSSVDPKGTTVKRSKVCVRCEKRIEDGKWIQVDSGGILCERCWKNMYLPKCRRCNLPIEKQAVSSSDGQLKGKYHKECFNCHTCHKPFPDKTFYVYEGKPMCAYHYHENNDSLCAAATCGQPIEGPCAVSHTGDRYHPDHMLCEYLNCKTRLDEYFEVDGRMLCERHARMSRLTDDDDEDADRWGESSRAVKRKTRFIDLAGAPRIP